MRTVRTIQIVRTRAPHRMSLTPAACEMLVVSTCSHNKRHSSSTAAPRRALAQPRTQRNIQQRDSSVWVGVWPCQQSGGINETKPTDKTVIAHTHTKPQPSRSRSAPPTPNTPCPVSFQKYRRSGMADGSSTRKAMKPTHQPKKKHTRNSNCYCVNIPVCEHYHVTLTQGKSHRSGMPRWEAFAKGEVENWNTGCWSYVGPLIAMDARGESPSICAQ